MTALVGGEAGHDGDDTVLLPQMKANRVPRWRSRA